MTIVYADFITAFPEFTSTAIYPTATINFWIPMAYDNLSQRRFKTTIPPGGSISQLDLAACLFVAHNVVLEAREARSAAAGQINGVVTGPTASKSVDKVSISYTDGATIDGAGPYNGTTYGIRLYQMFKAVAAGGLYVPGPGRANRGYGGFGYRGRC